MGWLGELTGLWFSQATWCFEEGRCTFGHYTSYLEVSFAVNVLVAGWLLRLLAKTKEVLEESKRRDSRRLDAMKADIAEEYKPRLDEIETSRERCNKWTGWMVGFSRLACLALAIVIVAALLSVEGGSSASIWWMAMFIVIPVALTTLVYVIDSRWSAAIEQKASSALDEVIDDAERRTQDAEVLRSKLPVD